MQIKADFTKEELMKNHDVLFEACHPIGRIRVLADLLWGLHGGELETGNVLKKENVEMMADMLNDACSEIEYLIDISNKQWQRDRAKWGGCNV